MFRFTIRDLLWLMVVAGMLLVMWIDRNKLNIDRAKLNTEREAVRAKQRDVDSTFRRMVYLTDELTQLVQTRKLGIPTDAEKELANQAAREELRRSIRGVPPSQKEAEPGIYFLQ